MIARVGGAKRAWVLGVAVHASVALAAGTARGQDTATGAMSGPAQSTGAPAASGAAGTRNTGFDLARNPPRNQRYAIWALPAWIAMGPSFGVYNASFGANIGLAPRGDLVIEAAYISGSLPLSTFGSPVPFDGAWFAVGYAFRFGSDRGLNGFFLEPKVYFALTSVRTNTTPGMLANGLNVNVGVGLDIGYQLTAGPLFFAPVVGIGIGGGGGSGLPANEARLQWSYYSPGSGPYPVVSLAMLRLGVAF